MFDDINEAYYWLDPRDDIRTQMLKKLRFYRRQASGLDFEDEMFDERKSYRILFLTVGIDAEHREDVTMQTMQRYRKRFFRHIREASANNELLYGIQGILWNLEEGGRGGGLHLHLVIFYQTGRSGDVSICRALGEYWVEKISRIGGSYRNSNANKHDFRNRWGIGVGLIGRHNDEMRNSLRRLIGIYMAKTTQEPRDSSEDDKLFGIIKPARLR